MSCVLLLDDDPRLKCVSGIRCSINARCQIVDYDKFKLGCECKEGFVGDGITCASKLVFFVRISILKDKQFKCKEDFSGNGFCCTGNVKNLF